MFKRLWKNEKGLTLIELLAVVVILGIIAAIAVPSIGGLIDNSKNDAHVANAQQMINSSKIWAATTLLTTTSTLADRTLTLQEMYDENLLDPIKDPDSGVTSDASADTGGYDTDGSAVVITVEADGKYTYDIYLTGNDKRIGTSASPIGEEALDKGDVAEIPAATPPAVVTP